MKVAIDKSTINQIEPIKDIEYIYIFDKEPLKKLSKIKYRCVNKDNIDNVHINLTNYDIPCIKKASINDKDWYKLPPKKDYKFAIIVPNYNNDHGNYKGKTFLRNCIESILNQTYQNFKLIIVDDCSTDTSVETIVSYKCQEEYIDKIHLVYNKRKRYNGGSRNVGIDYALDNLNPDYICFLDSDDWWKHNEVLEHINKKLYNHHMMILQSEMLFPSGKVSRQYNKFDNYEDIFFCVNKVWCTCWSKVIRADKIVHFCEDTLMEDRVWSYKQADNIDFDKVININEICYVWNRLNTDNSVSIVRGNMWEASAWCHIGHQLEFLETIKHKEMIPKLKERINQCILKIKSGVYEQY